MKTWRGLIIENKSLSVGSGRNGLEKLTMAAEMGVKDAWQKIDKYSKRCSG